MNDAPITDFDKLKNTLIEIGIMLDSDTERHSIAIFGVNGTQVVLDFWEDGSYLRNRSK